MTMQSFFDNRDPGGTTFSLSVPNTRKIRLSHPPIEEAEAEAREPAKIYPIWSKLFLRAFVDHGLKPIVELRRMLVVEIAPGEDSPIVARAAALDLSGVGNTIAEALGDLSFTAVRLWDAFKAMDEADLDRPARRAFARLRSHLEG